MNEGEIAPIALDRNARANYFIKVLATITAAIILAGATVTVWLALSILDEMGNVLEANNRYGARLVSCTTPGGECYEDLQRVEDKRAADGEANRTAASNRIIDPNGNGIPDVWELAEANGTPIPTTTVPGGNP